MVLALSMLLSVIAPTRPNADADFSKPARIAAHLERVERELRAVDVSDLPLEQRQRRLASLGHLRAYRERGVFPHNHQVAGQQPVFIDDHGTACAVGQLIIDSGHRPLAERIAREDRLGYLLEMNVEGLDAWVAASGFTAQELARIQPSYSYQLVETHAAVLEFTGTTPKLRWIPARSRINQPSGTVDIPDVFQLFALPNDVLVVRDRAGLMRLEGATVEALPLVRMDGDGDRGLWSHGERGLRPWPNGRPGMLIEVRPRGKYHGLARVIPQSPGIVWATTYNPGELLRIDHGKVSWIRVPSRFPVGIPKDDGDALVVSVRGGILRKPAGGRWSRPKPGGFACSNSTGDWVFSGQPARWVDGVLKPEGPQAPWGTLTCAADGRVGLVSDDRAFIRSVDGTWSELNIPLKHRNISALAFADGDRTFIAAAGMRCEGTEPLCTQTTPPPPPVLTNMWFTEGATTPLIDDW